MPDSALRPGGQLPAAASATCSNRDPIFSEGFETGVLDDASWEVGLGDDPDRQSDDVWDVADRYFCDYARSGTYAAHCSRDTCNGYWRWMHTFLRSKARNLLAYASYDYKFYALNKTQGGYNAGLRYGYYIGDAFIALGQIVSTDLPQWKEVSVSVNNATGDSSAFRMEYSFLSESQNVGAGSYIDDVSLKGVPRPSNLALVSPAGAVREIVLSNLAFGVPLDTLRTGTTYVRYGVRNTGLTNVVCPFTCRLYVDGSPMGALDTTFTGGLASGASADVQRSLSFPEGALITHTVEVRVDYLDEIDETNYFDNIGSVEANWVGPPNLVVQSQAVAPNPQGARQIATWTIQVRNTGYFRASASKVGCYRNSSTAPIASSTSDTVVTCPTLAPGSTAWLEWRLTSDAVGTWTMYSYADQLQQVDEGTHEGDNSSSGLHMTWSPPSTYLVGTVRYTDDASQDEHVLPFAQVSFLDIASTPPDTIVSTFCDSLGAFGPVRVTNASQHHTGPLDVLPVVLLNSDAGDAAGPRVRVVDVFSPSLTPHHFSGEPRLRMPDDSIVVFSVHPDAQSYTQKAACHVFGTVVDAWRSLGAERTRMSSLTVRWSAGWDFRSQATTSQISLNGFTNFGGPDEYDDTCIWHEYGHVVGRTFGLTRAAYAYDHQLTGPSWRLSDLAHYPAGGWSEGWADFFAGMARGQVAPVSRNGGVGGSGDVTVYDMETGMVTVSGGIPTPCGAIGTDAAEMSVASALWDLCDWDIDEIGRADGCEDRYGGSYAEWWQRMRGGVPNVLTMCGGTDVDWAGFFWHFSRTQPALNEVEFARLDSVRCAHALGVTVSGGCAGVEPSVPSGTSEVRVASSIVRDGRLVLLSDWDWLGSNELTVDLYSVDGRRVLRERTSVPIGVRQVAVPLRKGRTVPPGVYFVLARGAGKTALGKVVVLE